MFKTALTADERLARIRSNLRRFGYLPRLPTGVVTGSVAVCGFGPSLADTRKDVKKCDAVMTTSGAHDFLIGKGIVPTYHVELDPREHKVNFVRNSHPDVTYIINSQCHPKMFEALLPERNVWMWHGFTDDDARNQAMLVDNLSPGGRTMSGGTNVGMRAIVVARELGLTAFELHGMDCSYRGGEQWAGEHYTKKAYPITVEVEGQTFETSEQMLQSTEDFFNTMKSLRGCSFRIHGDGLLEARMRVFMREFGARQKASWFPYGMPSFKAA